MAIQRMYRYLLGILKPEMFGEDDNLNLIPNIQGTTDSGFSIKAFITIDGKDTPIKIEFPKLTQFALAYIEGEVDDNGYATYSIRSERLNMNLEGDLSMDPDREDVNFSLIKNVKIKAYYFHNDFMPKNQKTAFQRYLRDYGGLRLYRNGFRVLPYAEPNNDWL